MASDRKVPRNQGHDKFNETKQTIAACMNDTAFQIVRPLAITMALFGLLHFDSKERRCAVVTKIYSTVILLLLWAFVIRCFTLYGDIEIGNAFFMKLLVHSWSFWGASAATSTYFACRNQSKIVEFLTRWSKSMQTNREDGYSTDYVRKAKFRLYFFLIFTGIIFSISCVMYGYALFTTSFGDYLISPLPVNHKYTFILKCFVFVSLIYLNAAWIFTLCLFVNVGGSTYREFGILNKDFQKAVGPDGDIVCVELYRRRHQNICQMVEKADDILSGFCAASIVMSTVIGMVVLYSLIIYTVHFGGTLQLTSNIFWLIACLFYLSMIAIGGGYLNHAAHGPFITIHNIRLKECSLDVCLQMTMFLSKLTGQPIGLTVMGLFVIDKPTILTIAGVFLTYFVVLLQFKQPERLGVVGANCTNLTTA